MIDGMRAREFGRIVNIGSVRVSPCPVRAASDARLWLSVRGVPVIARLAEVLVDLHLPPPLDQQAQRLLDHGTLGFQPAGAHRLRHQLVVDLDIRHTLPSARRNDVYEVQ